MRIPAEVKPQLIILNRLIICFVNLRIIRRHYERLLKLIDHACI